MDVERYLLDFMCASMDMCEAMDSLISRKEDEQEKEYSPRKEWEIERLTNLIERLKDVTNDIEIFMAEE